jgi:RNA polymerase sigma-70 factor (sigma-E family)
MEPADEEAFTAFVRARGAHWMRLAVLLTGSPPEAEDLLQASLVKLYQAWPRLDVTTVAPDAYLRKILVNTRRSWWRARWRQESPVASVPDAADPYALGALVRAALATLPRQQRAVLVLRYVEDQPLATVAEILGCSAGTVKTHAHRGLRRLRAALGDLDSFAVNEATQTDGERK